MFGWPSAKYDFAFLIKVELRNCRRPIAVSVPNGANSNLAFIDATTDKLRRNFTQIVLAADDDEAGRP